jgi:hypothetical protein
MEFVRSVSVALMESEKSSLLLAGIGSPRRVRFSVTGFGVSEFRRERDLRYSKGQRER